MLNENILANVGDRRSEAWKSKTDPKENSEKMGRGARRLKWLVNKFK